MQWLLVQQGVCSDPTVTPLGAWPAYSTSEPTTPDNCVTIYDTQGIQEGRTMYDGEIQEHYGLQMRLRSSDHPTGNIKANWLRRRLALKQYIYRQLVTMDNRQYMVDALSNFGQIIPLGKDMPNSRRSIFTLNFMISVSEVHGTDNQG